MSAAAAMTPEEPVTSILEAMDIRQQAMQAQQQAQQAMHQQLMETLIAQAASAAPAQAQAQGQARAAERTEARSELIPQFITCPQFNGKLENWEEFQFRLKRAIRSQSSTVQFEMTRVEGSDEIINDEEPDIDLGGVNASMETSACLFDILCQHVEGDALVIIKSVVGYHGFEAWRRLHRKYSPRTLARRLRLLMAVVNPGKMKNVGEIQANLNMWEERISQLETQFKEKAISEPLKVAIITSAVPNKVQDYIFSQPEKDPSYAQIKEMIITYSSRMADNGPNPMDIGAVERQEQWDNWERNGWQEDQWEEDQWQGDQWGQQQDGSIPYDVNGVQDHSNSICYTCNQKGHISPQCPKGKGKGKMARAKERAVKVFREKAMAHTSPLEDGT